MNSERPKAVAFVDESGDRGLTKSSTPHFALTAVVLPESRRNEAARWLAAIRRDLGRGPQDELSWKRYPGHTQRLHVAERLGAQNFALITSAVICKTRLTTPVTAEDMYFRALRLLLERMTWLCREREVDLHYTLAHVRGFKLASLRAAEASLRAAPMTEIAWNHMRPEPSRIDRPQVEELLQIADAAASVVGAAFNPDQFGHVEQRYLHQAARRLYRGPDGPRALSSYGLKLFPSDARTRAAYPWVAALKVS